MPASDEVATSAPPPRATSSGTTARVPKTMPSTFTDRMRRYCSSVSLVMSSSPVVTPALRYAMSTPPSPRAASRMRAQSVDVADVGLHGHPAELRGRRLGSLAVGIDDHHGGALGRETRELARPIPEAPPVTTATLPSSAPMTSSSSRPGRRDRTRRRR